MNRTPNTTAQTNAKSTPPVFNYAQAAKRSSQNLDQQRPKSNEPKPNGNPRFNGTSTPTAKPNPPSFAAALGKTAPSNTSEMTGNHPTAPAPVAQPDVSIKPKQASVQLPRAPPTDAAPIQFGSINQPIDIPTPSPPKTSEIPTVLQSEVTFGSVNVTEAPSTRRDSTHSTHSTGADPHQPLAYHNNRYYSNNARPHYGQNKHQNVGVPHSPVQNPQPGYMHHNKMPTHMGNVSPNMAPQNIPMSHAWAASTSGQYFGYPPHYNQPPVAAYSSQPFMAQPRGSKAIPIINPETMKTVNLEATPSSSTSNKAKPEEKKELDFKQPTSRRVVIVDPAAKEREKREKEEQEQLEKERLEKERIENERIEEERLEKERIENKRIEEERIEKERIENERIEEERIEKERIENERIERERLEKERIENERLEKERLEKEEAERVAKEQAELAAKEEQERIHKEEALQVKIAAEEKARLDAERIALEQKEKLAKQAAEEKAALEEKERLETERKATAEKERLEAEYRASIPASEEKPKETREAQDSKIIRKSTPMRTIDDPSSVQYPENVIAPQAKGVDGKIQYDPVFLMQFQSLCLNTTEDLSAFQNIDEEYHDRHGRNGGGGNGTMQRRQTSERGRSSRPTGNPMEMGMFKHGSREGGGPMEMGKFSGGRILSHRAGSGGQGLPPAAQQGGMQRDNSHRGRSGRGGKGRHPPREQQGAPTIPLDQVVPLEKGNNRWVPVVLSSDSQASVGAASASEEVLISQETIVRKVKALLNKLTLEKFDSISDQIWEYAHQSSKEENGQSLRTVIQLTFDKACDEPPFAGMWAQLCRKMYNLMVDCDDIRDTTFKDSKGNFVSGGNLFRKYLLNKCQSDFERGWKFTVPELTEANKAEIMMSDEYYAAAKAKRQGLGLAQFIGELFKRGMLTDRIMLECLTKLCSKPNETEDEEAETMCKMLVTIGKDLDTTSRRNKEWMDTYFDRMREMSNSPKITSRIKFMIQDVSDMRKSKWVLRRGNQPAPTTISQIREEAQKAKNEEKETMKRTGSARGNLPHPVSRQTSHRGRDIQREGSASGNSSGNSGQATDGWSTVGTGVAASTGRNKAPDFPNFGKMERSKTRNNTFGPYNSQFPSSLNRNNSKVGDKKGATSDGRASPASPMTNMFSALGGEGQEEDKPQERRKLNLSPRGAGEKKPEEEASPVVEKPKMDKDQLERRCKNILEEYFSLRDKKELFECVKELDDPEYHVALVSRMLGVVERKAEDVALVCDIINDLYAENLVEKTAYVNAFKPFMEGYEDLIIDVPQAPKYVADIMSAAKVEWSEVADESLPKP